MSDSIRIGLEFVKDAVDVRSEINERYTTYKHLSSIVQAVALVEHSDFKNAVDAVYYLGGGWPNENSKGRMEKLLDNFSGMYKVLSLIGRGNLVEEHLQKLGIKVTLEAPITDVPLSAADVKLLNEEFKMSAFGFKPTSTSHLVELALNEALELQRFICANADKIKFELKPAAKDNLQVQDEEYNRLFYIKKFETKEKKVTSKKNIIESSLTQFRAAAKGL